MYVIAITHWKRKLIYLISLLIIVSLIAIIVPQILGINTVQTDSQPGEEEILTQPIKVQSTPNIDNSPEINPNK